MAIKDTDQEFWKARTFDAKTRRDLEHEAQTPTCQEQSGGEAHGSSLASGRVPGDVDEAREIPTDVVIRKHGEPDAFAQMPAAAPSMTDEEAGLDDKPPEAGIQPLLQRARPS
jgi:hypothetical protein